MKGVFKMTKEEFKEKLEKIFEVSNTNDSKEGFDIASKHEKCFLTFAVRAIPASDDIIITFGGYGLHFEVCDYPNENFDFEDVTNKFEQYFKGYESSLSFKDLYFCHVEQL